MQPIGAHLENQRIDQGMAASRGPRFADQDSCSTCRSASSSNGVPYFGKLPAMHRGSPGVIERTPARRGVECNSSIAAYDSYRKRSRSLLSGWCSTTQGSVCSRSANSALDRCLLRRAGQLIKNQLQPSAGSARANVPGPWQRFPRDLGSDKRIAVAIAADP